MHLKKKKIRNAKKEALKSGNLLDLYDDDGNPLYDSTDSEYSDSEWKETKQRKEKIFAFRNVYNLAWAGCSGTIPLSGRGEARVLFIVFLWIKIYIYHIEGTRNIRYNKLENHNNNFLFVVEGLAEQKPVWTSSLILRQKSVKVTLHGNWNFSATTYIDHQGGIWKIMGKATFFVKGPLLIKNSC